MRRVMQAAGAAGLLACMGHTAPAEAQNAPKTAVILKGRCEQLVIPAGDVSANCTGAVVNMIYLDGRSSFMFSDGTGDSARALISFSGMGSPSGASGTQPVDHVSAAKKSATEAGGTDVESENATGTCESGDYYKGSIEIRCTAQTQSGSFTASFKTDGAKPDVVNF